MAENTPEQHSGRFATIPSVALDDPRMSLTLLKLLCVIGSYGNRDGYCKVKLTTLAARMSHDGKPVGKPAISNGLRKLKDFGYIEVIPRFSKDIGQLSNMYRVLFDHPENMPQKVNPGSPLEVNPHTPLEVNPHTPLEVNPLNVLSERSDRTFLPTAAAISLSTREQVNGGASPEAAAAACNENDQQTAEALRRHLRMNHDKLPGLLLILRLYPGRRPWLENEANLCFATLKKRPIALNHFSNWLQEAERRRTAPREEIAHEQSNPANTLGTTAQHARKPTQAERVAEARAAARAAGLYVPDGLEDDG